MTNNAIVIHSEIKVKGQKLGTVRSLQYLGTVVSDDDSNRASLKHCARHCSSHKANANLER